MFRWDALTNIVRGQQIPAFPGIELRLPNTDQDKGSPWTRRRNRMAAQAEMGPELVG